MTQFNDKVSIGLCTLLICIIGLSLFGCASIRTTQIETSPEIISTDKISSSEEQYVNETDKISTSEEQYVNRTDYLNSPESVKLQIIAQLFAKSYFSGDLEGVKLYLADVNSAEVYGENIYNDLEYMILKWFPEDIASKTKIDVQYQFLIKGEDSVTYLGLVIEKISNEWKVTGFYLEK